MRYSALSPDHSLLLLPPPLSMPSSQLDLTIVARSTLASLAGRLGCLDRILRSAARLIGRIPKFGHVSRYMRDVLHWLPSEQRIAYRIAALVWRCLLGLAPAYLRELCCPVLSARGSRSLRSSEQGLLLVPFARTSTRQNRAFSVVGPRPGMASLWSFASFPGPSLLCSFLTLRLFFLAVLELGAPLSSFLEATWNL